MYKTIKPEPIKINVYVASIREGVSEPTVLEEIKKLVSSGLEEANLSILTHGKLYTISSEVIVKLRNFIDKKSEQINIITNDNEEHSKVIGGLTYRSLDLFLHKNGFKTIASKLEKGKRIYYKQDDPCFVFEVERDFAVFKAIRGLMPKVHADIPHSIYLFFVTDGSHIIEVKDWKRFAGEQVKIRLGYLEEQKKKQNIPNNISHSDIFKLESVEDNNANINDVTSNTNLFVPLSEIYVPATTRLLRKFDVFKQLLTFTSFREDENKAEYKFLEKALEKILPNSKEEFTLRVGLTDVVFSRVPFELEG